MAYQKAITLPFAFDSFGSVAYTADEKKIWQDRVVLVVMTSLNERIMRPTFGTTVNATIFENVNDAVSLIQQSVGGAFSKFLPSLSLQKVNGSTDPADGNIVIEVFYRYNDKDNQQSVKIKTGLFSRSGDLIVEGNGRSGR
jgi:phage baseplate assembly protein W